MIMSCYYTYALVSLNDGNLYIGITSDPERRLIEHNKGQVRSTKSRRPFKLFYIEKLSSRIEARNREKFLKSGCGREFLKYIPT